MEIKAGVVLALTAVETQVPPTLHSLSGTVFSLKYMLSINAAS
jgi:hypothetical protein